MKDCRRKIGSLKCCTIIHGDCADFLPKIPAGAVDLVITDPPYGMNYRSWKRRKHRPIHGDDHYPTEVILKLIKIPRLASYFFCRWDNLWEHDSGLPKPKSVIAWVKAPAGTGDCEGEHMRSYEMALFYHGIEHKFIGRPSDVLKLPSTGNYLHPTQKRWQLIMEMLEWYEFDTVLDPYCGSGSTLRAARIMNKHFLGFEIDRERYDIAVEDVEKQVIVAPEEKRCVTPMMDFGDEWFQRKKKK